MLARFAAFIAAVVVLCLVPACAAEDPTAPEPLVARHDVISPPRALDEVVTVEEGRLRVPRSAREHLANVRVGSVLVGGPSKTQPEQNPLGYLRRVMGIEEAKTEIVLATEQASLKDIYERGSFDVTLLDPKRETTARPTGPGLRTQSLEGELRGKLDETIAARTLVDMAEVVPDGVTTKATGKVTLDGGHVRVEPYIRLKTDFGVASVESFSAAMGLDYDAELAITADARIVESRPLQFDGKKLQRELIPWKHLAAGWLPTVPVPIPWTVKARVVAECTWSAAAAVKVTAQGRIRGNPFIELQYKADGGWSYEGNPLDVEPSGKINVAVEGNLSVRCAVTPALGIFIADVAGPSVTGGPWVAISGTHTTACPPPGVTLTATPGISMSFGGELTLFGVMTVGTKFYEKTLTGPPLMKLGQNCGARPMLEPCAGRADGYHCGADIKGDPGAQYLCLDGLTKGEAPCPNACRVRAPGDVLCE